MGQPISENGLVIKEMAMELKHGQAELGMKEISEMMLLKVKANTYMQMEMFMKGIEKIIRRMAMENSFKRM
jgi:hypothetical protein